MEHEEFYMFLFDVVVGVLCWRYGSLEIEVLEWGADVLDVRVGKTVAAWRTRVVRGDLSVSKHYATRFL